MVVLELMSATNCTAFQTDCSTIDAAVEYLYEPFESELGNYTEFFNYYQNKYDFPVIDCEKYQVQSANTIIVDFTNQTITISQETDKTTYTFEQFKEKFLSEADNTLEVAGFQIRLKPVFSKQQTEFHITDLKVMNVAFTTAVEHFASIKLEGDKLVNKTSLETLLQRDRTYTLKQLLDVYHTLTRIVDSLKVSYNLNDETLIDFLSKQYEYKRLFDEHNGGVLFWVKVGDETKIMWIDNFYYLQSIPYSFKAGTSILSWNNVLRPVTLEELSIVDNTFVAYTRD